eukprot:2205420-Rhodomonas_salina.2
MRVLTLWYAGARAREGSTTAARARRATRRGRISYAMPSTSIGAHPTILLRNVQYWCRNIPLAFCEQIGTDIWYAATRC